MKVSASKPQSSLPTPFSCVLHTCPLREMRRLYFLFPLPPQKPKKDLACTRLLSFLLGHEGPGSPFARLQDLGLATGLSAGTRYEDERETIFQVDVGLTAEGERRWGDVCRILFGYLRVLRGARGADLQSLWNEVCTVNNIAFELQTPGGGYGYAASVSQR